MSGTYRARLLCVRNSGQREIASDCGIGADVKQHLLRMFPRLGCSTILRKPGSHPAERLGLALVGLAHASGNWENENLVR